MRYFIHAITEDTTRDYYPSDDKEYDRIKNALQRAEKYTTINEIDTCDNERAIDMKVCIMTVLRKPAIKGESA